MTPAHPRVDVTASRTALPNHSFIAVALGSERPCSVAAAALRAVDFRETISAAAVCDSDGFPLLAGCPCLTPPGTGGRRILLLFLSYPWRSVTLPVWFLVP